MKTCINCNIEKSFDSFYKHKKMSDGRLNKCKDCCKSQSNERNIANSKNPEWIKKERARHRDKYSRLNYKDKQKVWDKDKPWKNTSIYKNLHRDLKIPKGVSAHHWNYADDKLKDIVLMDSQEHKAFHQLIELDVERRVFKIKQTGVWLDSRNKHLNFIMVSGFGFVEYNKEVIYQLVKKNHEESF